jgi:hypothetical protein
LLTDFIENTTVTLYSHGVNKNQLIITIESIRFSIDTILRLYQ